MSGPADGFTGSKGKLAFVDLTRRSVRIEPADPECYRAFVGGRGVQASLLNRHLKDNGPIRDPLSGMNRIIIGTGPLNDTAVPTSGRGSCSFIGTMTRSPEPASWIPEHKPLFGLITHASNGGIFPNMLKRTSLDHLIIDGRAESPVRLVVGDGNVRIMDAEREMFENIDGRLSVRPVSTNTRFLSSRHPGSSSLCVGPAGWNQVAYACLTNDHHRNFGRGGAGAVFGSKNLAAVTALGHEPVSYYDQEEFRKLSRELDSLVKAHVGDPSQTASFRPVEGTTFWLDRAFRGAYLGKGGGYLPWHNYDEGSFDSSGYAGVSTESFRQMAGKHFVCNRCRHIMCTRAAQAESPPFAGIGVRPEFETIALFINCGILDPQAIFHLNHLCNEYGIDTMSFAAVAAGAMELGEKGYLGNFPKIPVFGSAESLIRLLLSVAYRSDSLGMMLGKFSDDFIGELSLSHPAEKAADIAYCLTTSFGGLGYAGISPKAFPGMFLAYGTSNRGRGDHTYAWTIQAEEAGLAEAGDLAAYVAEAQIRKALIDSLGLCDFFTEDTTSELFSRLYSSLTGFDFSPERIRDCGRRIYGLERHVNNIQGRRRAYDAYVPPKLKVPLTRGAHKGKWVDPDFAGLLLERYYEKQGWTSDGIAPEPFLE